MNIEIGTSDFRTLAGQADGIYVEPVKYYFDRLPDCVKENVAVSNQQGYVSIYYLTDEEIDRYKLPQWIRGCNSIRTIHPSIKEELDSRGVGLGVVHRDRVEVVRIKSIIDKYKVTSINTLKIDTEGHDTVILNDFFDTVDIKPKTIIFENNILSDKTEIANMVERLKGFGYSCQQVKYDIVAKLKG